MTEKTKSFIAGISIGAMRKAVMYLSPKNQDYRGREGRIAETMQEREQQVKTKFEIEEGERNNTYQNPFLEPSKIK